MVDITGGAGTGGVSFPIVFFDGECETDIGTVLVFPSLDFKRFQSLLSRKIGISPHQFSVYLASPETRKRIPITGKVNFGAISREKGCFFVVVLKRSRRERRRKSSSHNLIEEDLYYSSPASAVDLHRPIKNNPPAENFMLLRRDMEIHPGFFSSISDRVGYETGVINYQLEKERYLMNMGLNGLLGLQWTQPSTVGEESVKGSSTAVCEDCFRAKESGTEVGFHCCVYDAVTYGFRSTVGPIARPVKRSDDFGSLGFSEM